MKLINIYRSTISMLALACAGACVVVKQIAQIAVEICQPTVEHSLKEINATGHAAKRSDAPGSAPMFSVVRNSAAMFVAMLKSRGFEAASA